MTAGRVIVGLLLLIAVGVLIKLVLFLAGVYVPSASITGIQPPAQQTPAPAAIPQVSEPAAELTPPAQVSEPEQEQAQPQPEVVQTPVLEEQSEPSQDVGEDTMAPADIDTPSSTGSEEAQVPPLEDTGEDASAPEDGDAASSPASYVVQRGDSLWKIARRSCGGGAKYRVIYQKNRGNIRNPHRIWPDQVIEFPDICR